MITPAYESFVNNVCMDIANESISDKIKSGWDKVIKFWDSVIKFIQKKINEFISFIENIFTKKKKLSEKDAEVKSSNTTNIDNSKKDNAKADNNAVTNKFIDYGEYCKISGNLYLMCVNIDKIIFNLKYYISAIKKDPGNIYDFIEVLDEANNCVDNPEKYIRTSYFCTITGNDNNHLDEDWIIKKDTLLTLAYYYLNNAKDNIKSIKNDLEKFNPNDFDNEYSKIQNSMILCGKLSSKIISKVCEIKNNISSVSQDDFDKLYHKF